MIRQEDLDILRCPVCTQHEGGVFDFYKENWLICSECGRKFPVWDGIPVLMIDEGDKWLSHEKESLPIPPPQPK